MSDGAGTSLHKYDIAAQIADTLGVPADTLGLCKLNMAQTKALRAAINLRLSEKEGRS